MIILAKTQQKLLQNFYVDDLLNSRKDAAINNRPDELSAIPEEDRKVGVNDQELLTDRRGT